MLNVVEEDGPPRVILTAKPSIDLFVPKGASRAKREWILQEWYRKELKAQIPPMIAKWEHVMGVSVAAWGVKRMRTRWGSCNIRARRIWLNLELAKKSERSLEYVIVHEMVHLLERHHDARFTGLLEQVIPDWRLRRDELNMAPLAHENWEY